MASTRAGGVLSCLLCFYVLQRSEAAAASACGGEVGDMRQSAKSLDKCKQCGGADAELMFDGSQADGMGWTYCSAKASTLPPLTLTVDSKKCGGGIRDQRKDKDAMDLCRSCFGSGAELVFYPSRADAMGETICEDVGPTEVKTKPVVTRTPLQGPTAAPVNHIAEDGVRAFVDYLQAVDLDKLLAPVAVLSCIALLIMLTLMLVRLGIRCHTQGVAGVDDQSSARVPKISAEANSGSNVDNPPPSVQEPNEVEV